jgi:O-antigen/teichoic acid export membrane protein
MREAIRVIAFQWINFGLQVLFMLLAARMLGPAGQGGYALVRTSVYLTETLMWLGLNSGLTYFVAVNFERYHHPLIKTCLFYLAFIVSLGTPILLIVLPHFNVAASLVLLGVSWVMTLGMLQLFLKVFIGQRRYDLFNYINLLTSALTLILFATYQALSPISVLGVILCNIVGNFAGILCAVGAHWKHLRRLISGSNIDLTAIKEFYRIGLKGYISSVAFIVLYRVDFFLVGYFLGARTLGLYTVAVFVIEAIQKVPDWLGMILGPKVSAGMDQSGIVTRKYVVASTASVVGVAVLLSLLHGLRINYIQFLLGGKYDGVEPIILWLMPKAILHAIMVIYGGNLSGKGYTLYHPLAGAGSLLTLFIVDLLLIPSYGLWGAIAGITIAYCVATVVMVQGTARQRTEQLVSVG